jgi:hypothetical protein
MLKVRLQFLTHTKGAQKGHNKKKTRIDKVGNINVHDDLLFAKVSSIATIYDLYDYGHSLQF